MLIGMEVTRFRGAGGAAGGNGAARRRGDALAPQARSERHKAARFSINARCPTTVKAQGAP
jgi:hypothetical protein